MLLYAHIGFWYHMHIQTMKQTTFLIQNERTTFQEIIKASTLPSFITNLSIKKEGIPENRIIIPFDEQDAHVTFYFSILKKNKNKMIKLIQKIQEKKRMNNEKNSCRPTHAYISQWACLWYNKRNGICR